MTERRRGLADRGAASNSAGRAPWTSHARENTAFIAGAAIPAYGIPFPPPEAQPSAAFPAPTHLAAQPHPFNEYHQGSGADVAVRAPRFLTTLHQRSALVGRPDEVREAYLNTGQSYDVSVRDTQARSAQRPNRFRTCVRVTFDEVTYRQNVPECWKMWTESRGFEEARRRGGRIQAIEYAGVVSADDQQHPEVELFDVKLDHFCIIWTTRTGEQPRLRFQFLCNFMSTDFTQARGVRGVSLRLCAKTECLEYDGYDPQAPVGATELRYCKIRTFRDHGAERKFNTDDRRVLNKINKLEGRMRQTNSGSDVAKAGRSGSVSSESSGDSPNNPDPSARDNGNRARINACREKLASSVSEIPLLALAELNDDPDLNPLQMDPSMQTPTMAFPDPRPHVPTSVQNIPLQGSPIGRGFPYEPEPLRINFHSQDQARMWSPIPPPPVPSGALSPSHHSEQSVSDAGSTMDDAHSRRSSTAGGQARPALTIYVRFNLDGIGTDDNFRAVYLYERSLTGFVHAIARKVNRDPSFFSHVLYVSRDLTVAVDDEFVFQMTDRQAMAASIAVTENTFDPYFYTIFIQY